MCLSIPSEVVEIDPIANTAIVDTMGVQRIVGLDLMEEDSVNIGDYVLIHIGFIMNIIDKHDALESLRIYRLMLDEMDEKDQLALITENDISSEDSL